MNDEKAGPWYYAARLCGERYPTVEGVFAALRLGRPMQADRCDDGRYRWSQKGPYLLAGDSVVMATGDRAVVPGWMVALVLASVVHRSPPAELLAVAGTLIAERRVEVVR